MHTAVGLECTGTQYTFIFEEVQILKFAELSDSTSLMERLSSLFFFFFKEALSLSKVGRLHKRELHRVKAHYVSISSEAVGGRRKPEKRNCRTQTVGAKSPETLGGFSLPWKQQEETW